MTNHVIDLSDYIQSVSPTILTLIECAIILFMTMILSIIEGLTFHRVYPKLKASEKTKSDRILYAVHKPLQLIIWTLGITYTFSTASDLLNASAVENFSDTMSLLRQVVLVAAFTWAVLRFIRLLEDTLVHSPEHSHQHKKRKLDKATAFAVSRLLRIVTICAALLVILQIAGVKVSALIALGGAGTLIAGLAAREMLANFFGALMIYTDRPFSVGDWIRSNDRNIEGTVEEIGWRLTRVRTFDKRPLYIPNAIFSSITVENPSRMHNRRIKTVVGIGYESADKISLVRDGIEDMLRKHEEIDTTQTLFVRVSEFGPSSINIQIYCFTKTIDWLAFERIQEDVLLKILDIVRDCGANIAYPTQTLYLKNPQTERSPHHG
ncbi:MAG: mechanosensitive ion channel protein MscS [Gammaproteobacteria bacterium CG11_big_fil_rev_8_21_14_0_20_46_22]|nr:MAG: mechanosensitive ion channel protein MscS [Gammaproteobacteria bacterium CG12_big_fil_rev_8_21_14_0_65_46_12]PIR11900.1 MAG: mechanosensitive ion channel protein MscS [Gammaproteobacteria bacterium CG11_big_fil_rev_8_21_14_0_20_46_22]